MEDSELERILSATKIKILIWGIFGLASVLSFVTGWQQIKVANFPSEYVQLERYKSDTHALSERYKADTIRSEKAIIRIENKIDSINDLILTIHKP